MTTLTLAQIKLLSNDDVLALSQEELQQHLITAIEFLNIKGSRGPSRREEVLALLKDGPHTILEMAEKLGIDSKNVSSQLSYLRKDGWVIHTDENSRKYLAQDTPKVLEEDKKSSEDVIVRKSES